MLDDLFKAKTSKGDEELAQVGQWAIYLIPAALILYLWMKRDWVAGKIAEAWAAVEGLVITAAWIGLAVLVVFTVVKVLHIRKSYHWKAVRIVPREGVEIREKTVLDLAGSLSALKRRPENQLQLGRIWLRWVIHRDAKEGKIHFWIICPLDQLTRVKRLIANGYPNFELHVEDTIPFPKATKGEGGHLKLVRDDHEAFGIQDSINKMASVLSMMNQGTWIDIRFSPTNPQKLRKKGRKAVEELMESQDKRTLEEREKIKAATDRYLGRAAFDVSISLWSTKSQVTGLAGEIYNSFRSNHNALELKRYIFFAAKRNAVGWRLPVPLPWRRMVMTDQELANFMMFPDPQHEVSEKLVKLEQGQRTLKKDEFNEGYTVGQMLHPFIKNRPIKFPVSRFLWHPVISGATGSGKGAFITTFADEFLMGWAKDPHNHAGWTLIDPHRDTILKIISRLLKMEQEGIPIDWDRIHYFYLGKSEFPVGLNLLHKQEGDDIDQLTDQAASLIKAAYPGDLSRTSVLIENGIATLLADDRPRTIAELPRLFQDKKFRNDILERVKNPAVQAFWKNEDRKEKETNIEAMLTRLNPFFRNTAMQQMFGQTKNVIDAKRFFEEGHLVFIDMNGVSEATFQLAGGWIANKYHNEAARRGAGRPHYLWIDEAPLLKKVDTLVQIVQEDRKRGLGLGIITQDIDKLDKDLSEALKVNSGIVISLGQGAGAKKAADLMGNEFSPNYLRNLKTFEAAVWVRSMGTVSMKLKPPVYYLGKKATAENSKEEKEAARLALKKVLELLARPGEGTPVKEAEKEILERLQQAD